MAKRTKAKPERVATGAKFMACPPQRTHETPERQTLRVACEKRAAAAGLKPTRLPDVRPTLHTPKGYRYSSGSVVFSQVGGGLASEERRAQGCLEVGYTISDRAKWGCARDAEEKFTGSLADGTKDGRCTQDRKFSGERRAGGKTYRDPICGAGFKPPCETRRHGTAEFCPIQFVVVGGTTGLRLCHAQGESGGLLAAPSAPALDALATDACAWYNKHGRPRMVRALAAKAKGHTKQYAALAATVWDGFRPEQARGLGRARRRELNP
jgi:hypothetical protein